MVLNGQKWLQNDKYIYMELRQPYWGAYIEFHWTDRVPGISISKEAMLYALKNKLNILVKVGEYGYYQISPKKATDNGRYFIARNSSQLLCIPQSLFRKIKTPELKFKQEVVQYRFEGNRAIPI